MLEDWTSLEDVVENMVEDVAVVVEEDVEEDVEVEDVEVERGDAVHCFPLKVVRKAPAGREDILRKDDTSRRM